VEVVDAAAEVGAAIAAVTAEVMAADETANRSF
jgi:hypothetical protein